MEASLETVQMPDGEISSADSQAPNTRVGRLLKERERKKGNGNGNGSGEPENPGNGSAEKPGEERSSEASALAVDQERERTDATDAKQRLLVVANRLPVRAVRKDGGDWELEVTPGGLVSALVGVTEFDIQWIGWPGLSVAESDEAGRQTLTQALAKKNCTPVFLDEKTIEDYYNGYCNNVLWPLFHYLGLPKEDRLAATHTLQSQFEAYQKANKLFAEVVNARYKEDDIVWCHDYHLMFLPKYLKEHNSGMKVGWFLHTPFPSSEIHRILPSRSEVLHAVLAADLVGFQTYDYARHFLSACTRILGLEGTPSGVEGQGKLTRVAAFPIGIPPHRFIGALEDPEVQDDIKEQKEKFGERKIIIGVDRLDMIKGIPQKILAFEKFLEENPEWHEKVVLVQIAVPSRTGVREYQQLRSQVHELVGRINGRFGTFSCVPIHHLDRNLSLHELCALYSVADIALVTSLRDGMNLVSYEFVVCQKSEKGVLILSEFAGAAQSLGAGAILVNPWNITEIASAIGQALNMPAEEREKRHQFNFEHVMTHTAQQWAEVFISELNDTLIEAQQRIGTVPPPLVVNNCIQGFLQSKNRLLVLGFNAVLTEQTDTNGRRDQLKEMELKLHPDVKEPLRILCNNPNTTVLVLSGSGRTVLDNNLKEYNMWLAAENGIFVRSTNGEWMTAMPDHMNIDWIDSVKDVFEYFTERTPRSRCDVRETSVVWNYKYSNIEFGKLQARDMLEHLWTGPISNKSVDIIQGSHSVEVRPVGITKGLSIQCILSEILQSKADSTPFDYVLCIGHFLGKDEDIYRYFDPEPPLATPKSPSKPKATDTMKHICEREPGKDEDKSPKQGQKKSPRSEASCSSKCSSLKHTPGSDLLDLKKENYFSCAVGRSHTNARYLLNSSDDAVALLKDMAAACSPQNEFSFQPNP